MYTNISNNILKNLEDLKKRIDSGELTEEDIQWEKDWFPHVYNAVTGKAYSLIHSFYLSSFGHQGELDPRFLTFDQAKMNGWNIKVGSKGIPIVFVINNDRNSPAQPNSKIYLFNASQCEGIPLLKKNDVNIDVSLLEGLAKDLGIKLNFKNSNEAMYDQLYDTISIPKQFKNSQSLYSICFHELIHSTGGPTRLNRPSVVDYHKDIKERAKEELIAEMGSIILSKDLNVKYNFSNELNYIYHWSKKLEKDAFFDVVLHADKAANYLKKLPTFQIYISQIEQSRACGKIYKDLPENKLYKNKVYKKSNFQKNQLIQSR